VIRLFFINNVYGLFANFALFIQHFFIFVTFLVFYVFVHHPLHFDLQALDVVKGSISLWLAKSKICKHLLNKFFILQKSSFN
jgi:hypothetical protein